VGAAFFAGTTVICLAPAVPTPLVIRCTSLLLTAALCIAWRHSPDILMWSTYSLGFAHYFLALRYSTRQMGQALKTVPQALLLLGLALFTVALYADDFPLVAYFGLHHALNEAYLRRAPAALAPASHRRFHAAAVALQAVAYVTVLRSARGFSWVDAKWLVAALGLALGLFLRELSRLQPRVPARQGLDLCASEVAALLLVVVSLFVRVTFLQAVLYHFVLWALLPLEAMRQRARLGLGEYVGLSAGLVGMFVLLSPLGPAPTRINAIAFSQQFLFWSYVHITLSFALSDAHPAWMIRLFRGSAPQAVSPPVPASS